MARENTVILYGQVCRKPRILQKDDQFLTGKVILYTLRRSSATKQQILRGEARYDNIPVFSRNHDFIEKNMLNIEENDMVLVKGTLCTLEIEKTFYCPHCNQINKRDGVIIFVDPIYIKKCEMNVCDLEERDRLLMKSEEISNMVKIMGTLCRDPEIEINEDYNRTECNFQIASNRNRHILEDDPKKRTDYPWVKAYGASATEYCNALHMNSTIYINGAIQVRNIRKRHLTCDYCHEAFTRPDTAVEIIPYNIEYIDDCIIPDTENTKGDEIDE